MVRTTGQWFGHADAATMRCVELRPTSTKGSQVLQRRIARLVAERQRLRELQAAEGLLEQNRLEIVQTQLELSQALVSEHLAASAA